MKTTISKVQPLHTITALYIITNKTDYEAKQCRTEESRSSSSRREVKEDDVVNVRKTDAVPAQNALITLQ